jgi:hypothetical protein
MKLAQATFLGLRGLRDEKLDFLDKNSRMPASFVLVTGPSASGKTRALEAILMAKEAIAPYAAGATVEGWHRDGVHAAKVVLTWWLNAEEQASSGSPEAFVTTEAILREDGITVDADEGVLSVLERYRHDDAFGKVEYFPESRRLLAYGPSHGTSELEQSGLRTERDVRKYGFVPRFLQELARQPARQRAFSELVTRLAPALRYAPGEYPEVCFRSREAEPVGYEALSSSEADAVIFAATTVMLGLSHSIVLIDRPDLHLGFDRLGAYLNALTTIGTDNQIIAASPNAAIASAVAGARVISLGAAGAHSIAPPAG